MPLAENRENPVNKRTPQIIAVGGGKGGIGKTIITVNLGVSMVWKKKRVILVDADLGGANLHTCLGVSTNNPTLSDFMMGSVSDIRETLIPTEINGLQIISGARDALNVTDVSDNQKVRLMSELKSLDADYILLDLGAGTTQNVIDFFLLANKGLLVMLPEPTSIENIYRFIKVAFYRKLRALESSLGVEKELSTLLGGHGSASIKTPRQLLDGIKSLNKEKGEALYHEMMKFSPNIVINMVRSSADVEIGSSVTFACKKYFGINVNYLGHIQYSNCIWQSVRNRRPLMVEFPNSTLVTGFSDISKKLEEKHSDKIR